jgi:hypothetical protein
MLSHSCLCWTFRRSIARQNESKGLYRQCADAPFEHHSDNKFHFQGIWKLHYKWFTVCKQQVAMHETCLLTRHTKYQQKKLGETSFKGSYSKKIHWNYKPAKLNILSERSLQISSRNRQMKIQQTGSTKLGLQNQSTMSLLFQGTSAITSLPSNDINFQKVCSGLKTCIEHQQKIVVIL